MGLDGNCVFLEYNDILSSFLDVLFPPDKKYVFHMHIYDSITNILNRFSIYPNYSFYVYSRPNTLFSIEQKEITIQGFAKIYLVETHILSDETPILSSVLDILSETFCKKEYFSNSATLQL